MPSKFVHLHTHSHYSLLTALPKIGDLVERAKKLEMPALALTDNGNLYGAIEFYQECKKAGIKPIIGIDAYLAPRTRFDKQHGVDNRNRSRLVILAKDMVGYKNLVKIVTDSHLEGFYYKPRVDRELLEKYKEGLVVLIPPSGEIAQALKTQDKEKAFNTIDWYKNTYGAENVFLEITHHPEIPGHPELMKDIITFAHETHTAIAAAHEVYYLEPEDKIARDTLMMVQSSGDMSDRAEDETDFSFITPKQAEKYFKHIPEALENTAKIVDMCSFDIELGKWVFPNFEIPNGNTPDDELRRVVYLGFARRNVAQDEATVKRVEYELKIIKDKGYSPYFLIVADLLRFARENEILSNIRGSVSGSMVTYLAGITNIDPIEYEIPFERFLNPERPSAPDIDMDYADDRREEILNYAKQKYGENRVAQIGTFGTMAARGSVRDVSRALGFPVSVGDRIAKLIPMGSQGHAMTIDKALEDVEELRKMYKSETETKQIIDMARKIEGSARHIGVHAAGVVMSPTELTDFTALQFDPKGEGKIITQYDMYSIEEAGLLKFDFLGLKNLTIIANTKKLIKSLRAIDIDVDTIPINDAKTFEMLARGETADLFQLNGDGMTRFLKELKPTTIHDINAMVALYRPGPIQFIPEYIARKHDASKISYLDPALEKILNKTYGILVYQDDLLMMAHLLAGYSWLEVDKFRKAVGKKIPEEMEAQKGKFIQGCVKVSGWSEEKAQKIWSWIEPFASYGFNKAHSVSYGRVAYLTAYLKANFPGEYMTAVLMAEAGDVDKVSETVKECKRMNLPVLAPDVNESFNQFTLIKGDTHSEQSDRIRFGLVSIKNFGEGCAQTIIEERTKGKFTSLENFLTRVKDRSLNKKSLEALIKAGALDQFENRSLMLGNLEGLLAFNKEQAKEASAQDSLFGGTDVASHLDKLRLKESPIVSHTEMLMWEKELLGLYVSGHPLDKFRQILDSRDTNIKKAKEELKDGNMVVVGGIIEEVKPIATKKGDMMMFIKLADFSGSIEAVIFPKTYIEYKDILVAENCIALKGKFSERNGTPSLLAEKIKLL